MENDNSLAESSGQRQTPDNGEMFCFSVLKSPGSINVTQNISCQYVRRKGPASA